MITSWSVQLLSVMIMTGAVLIAPAALEEDVQDMNGPIITPPYSEIILQSGQNFTLLCKGKMPVRFKQQEVPEEVTGYFNMSQRDVPTGNQSWYEVALDLYNVDQFAIGYYACYDSTVNSSDVLNNILEEPTNTPHISYIYIYVNGSSMFAPMRSFIIAKSKSKFLIECRPTTPDINVTLTVSQSNKTPDSVFSRKIGFVLSREPKGATTFKCESQRGNEISTMHIRNMVTAPPHPNIKSEYNVFLKGETFTLNCTVKVNTAVALSWSIPGLWSKVVNETNENAVSDINPNLYSSITITNATKEDAGIYNCTSRAGKKEISSTFTKEYLEEPKEINITTDSRLNPEPDVNKLKILKMLAKIDSYPPANVTFLLNNKTLHNVKDKYITKFDGLNAIIAIKKLDVTDAGNYTIFAKNRYKNNSLTFDVRVKTSPRVTFEQEKGKRYLLGTEASLVCEVVGYPSTAINWIFSNENMVETFNKKHQTDTVELVYKTRSVLKIPVNQSGNITCEASNEIGKDSVTQEFCVNEIIHGFGIENSDTTWFSEGQKVELTCLASIFDFVNVTWDSEVTRELVEYWESPFSYVAKLIIHHATPSHSNNYTCYGQERSGTYKEQVISLHVAATQTPIIHDQYGKTEPVIPFQPVNLTCDVNGVPPPEVEWYKDGTKLINGSNNNNIKIYTTVLDQGYITSMVTVHRVKQDNLGKYECVATSQSGTQNKVYELVYKEERTSKTMIFSVIGAIFAMLIVLVAYLTWKIRKEKQFRKELAEAGLLNFKEGLTKSINPDLGIDEQAELLPYDEKFEFPPEKLHLGKQLGAGAFGVVYKAEARGIINAEETTVVAVKMVKKSADNMYIKALASELKIMVHLGKHINIVNLLGACTKNVGKRELSVIVEYCKFGNIHNYMQKHREVFIDQLTDNAEKNMGKINRGYSCSSGNSGTHSDYFGSNHTQETDNTFLNTANTNRSGRKDNANKQVEFVKVSETGYLQPEWRSNYESDYSFDGRSPRPLFSRDLLAWAFQIARGMEYLASRKVLHGDLAARNILLAEDNVVKICDFGLARSIYKNDEYQKQENSPLPLKWLAIECMTDRIFSTQSDIWSFGIVLWELFSLAKTPYPNINPHSLLQWLSEGNRLEKPPYADDRLYDVMKRCWELKPTARPTFSQLQQILGSFLEDNVRNHYVDLNAAYMDMNTKREGEEDYLAMVCAPDYNNLVTPSPHHYVNDVRSFFPPTPTQLQHDDEGYLQMSPATRQNISNARLQGNKFDFDARKLSPRVSDANSHGSELTPMLTVNSLPRSGSESDHEGNSSPYLNMCPRIEEETDEVFEVKHNNVKNTQPCAVTNPTYITLSPENEKKPHNFTNNYINVNVSKGLVT